MVRKRSNAGAVSAGFLPSTITSMGEMSNAEAFRRVAGALDAAKIPYMLVGSFASSHYGELRSTYDIDVVVAATPEQLRTFTNLLPIEEYYRDLESAIEAYNNNSMFNILDMVTGFKIDLILLKPGAFSQDAFRRRQLEMIEGNPLFVSTPEDVIVAKLEWAKMGQSTRQIGDVAGLLRKRWASLDHSYLGKWIAELGLTSQWEEAKQQSGLE